MTYLNGKFCAPYFKYPEKQKEYSGNTKVVTGNLYRVTELFLILTSQ